MSNLELMFEVDARGVATLTFNRNEKGNSYTSQTLSDMHRSIAQVANDPSVRLLVLRAIGKHFCVGADLSATSTPQSIGMIDVCMSLYQLSKPSVAMVQGACIGGGVAFISCCDVVLADTKSFFSIPEVRIGFSPGPLTPFFMRAMGERLVKRYAQTGERFVATDALRIGLVHQLVDDENNQKTINTLIEDLLMGAPNALSSLKATLSQVAHQPITMDLLQALQKDFDRARTSDEAEEGKQSFLEKRKPNWYRQG
jgi:methylglutaconyl-CoA hydratase